MYSTFKLNTVNTNMASNRASPGLSTTPSTKGTKDNKKKNLVQLNIKCASAAVKNAVVSDKKAEKTTIK